MFTSCCYTKKYKENRSGCQWWTGREWCLGAFIWLIKFLTCFNGFSYFYVWKTSLYQKTICSLTREIICPTTVNTSVSNVDMILVGVPGWTKESDVPVAETKKSKPIPIYWVPTALKAWPLKTTMPLHWSHDADERMACPFPAKQTQHWYPYPPRI